MRASPTLALLAGALLLPAVARAATTPIVTASLTPRSALFADLVQAEVDVTVDTRTYEARPASVSTPLGIWTQVTPTTTSTTHAGTIARTRIRLTISCQQVACAPQGGTKTLQLPPVSVRLRSRDGTLRQVRAAWPSIVVASRLPAGASAETHPPFRPELVPAPARTRVSASAAAWALDVVAGALAATALGLAARELRARRRRAVAEVSDLERALRLAREAEGRPGPDRRRALALLARVAPSADAAETAWRPAEPSPERLEDVVQQIEEGRR